MTPGRVRRLANCEDDVLDELREQQDVGHVRLESLLEQPRRAVRRDEENRGAGVLADRGKLVRGQARAPRRVEDGVQVAARQRAGAVSDANTRADHLDLGVVRERLAQLLESLAGPRRIDSDALTLSCLCCGAHRGLLPGPSNCNVCES